MFIIQLLVKKCGSRNGRKMYKKVGKFYDFLSITKGKF